MRITDYLVIDRVIADLDGKDKLAVLEELARAVAEPCRVASAETLVQVLLEREKLQSTGIGNGIAIPHGRLKGLKDFVVCFGRSLHGADFDSIDQRRSHLFFLVMAPENSALNNLKLLSRIVTLLKDPSFKKQLMEADSQEELFRIIKEEDDKY